MPTRILIFVIAVLAATPAWSQDDEIAAELTQELKAPDSLLVGQAVTLNISIQHPTETQVIPPESFDRGRWELVQETHTETPTQSGALSTNYQLTYSVFRPGETTLSALEFNVVSARDSEHAKALKTQPVTLKFVTNLPAGEETALKPEQPPVSIWVDDYALAYVGGGLASLGLLGLVLLWTRQRKVEIREYIPPPPPHDVALNKLGALAGSELIERGQYMIFYVRLSEAVREYLGQIYGFPGTEFTTSEIQSKLKDNTWPRGLGLDDVIGLLQHCDLVKFSGIEPSVEQGTEALRRAFTVVELTRPRAEPATLTPETNKTEAETKVKSPSPRKPTAASPWAPDAGEEE